MLPRNLAASEKARLFRFGEWKLDTAGRFRSTPSGTVVSLSGAEYRLLRVFLDHPQHVLNRDQLLDLTQGREAEVFDRSIDLLVSRLRQRLRDDAREPSYHQEQCAAKATSLPSPSRHCRSRRERALSAHGASLWPGILFGRLAMILLSGLVAAHVLAFVLIVLDHDRHRRRTGE